MKKTAATYPALKREQITTGMEVRIHQKIQDIGKKGEAKERIQIFEGLIIGRHGGTTPGATFTVRKESFGVGVERIFPLWSSRIEKVELVRQFKTRRKQLTFLRKKYLKKLKVEA